MTKRKQPSVRTTMTPPRGRQPVVITLAGPQLTVDAVTEMHASAAVAKKQLDVLIRALHEQGYSLGDVDIVEETAPEPEEYVHVEENAVADEVSLIREEGRSQLLCSGDRGLVEVLRQLRLQGESCMQVLCNELSPGDAWSKALAKVQLLSLRDIIFDTHFETQTRQGQNSFGDLRATLDACPALERLFATGALALSPGSHATLRELHALGDPLSAEFLRGLGASQLPALERLVLSLASDAESHDDAAFRALVDLDAPKLRSVHVLAVRDVARALSTLLGSERLGVSKVLSLSGTADEDELIDVVERNAAALSALEVLALPIAEAFSTDGGEKLRSLCASVRDVDEFANPSLPAAYESWRSSPAPKAR